MGSRGDAEPLHQPQPFIVVGAQMSGVKDGILKTMRNPSSQLIHHQVFDARASVVDYRNPLA